MPYRTKQEKVAVNIQSNLTNNSLEFEIIRYLSAEAAPISYKKTLYLNEKGEFDSSRIILVSQDCLKMSAANAVLIQLPGIEGPLVLQSDRTLILGEILSQKCLELKNSGNIICQAPLSVHSLCLHGKKITINEDIKLKDVLELHAEISIQSHKNLQARNIELRCSACLYNKGIIRATEKLSVEALSIDNLGAMFAKIFKADLDHKKTALLDKEPLKQSIYFRNAGLIQSSSSLSLNVSGKVINHSSAKIGSLGNVSIKTQHQFKNAILGQVFAKGRLFVRSNHSFINQGFLSGAENVMLVGGKKLQNSGLIQSFKALTVYSERSLDNQAIGKIIAEMQMTLRSEDNLQNSGVIVAKEFISIHSQAGIQNGETGKILSNTTVKIIGLGILNNLGEIAGHLQVNTQTLGDTLNGASARMQGSDLSIATLKLLHNQGMVYAEQSLKTKTNASHNAEGAVIQAEGKADLQSYSTLINSGKILANNLLLKAGALANTLCIGEISAGSKLSFNIENELDNQNLICSEGEIIVHTKQFDNAKTASIISKNKTELFATQINNVGLIEANQLFLKVGINLINNETARLVAKQDLKVLSVGTIENRGEISSLGELCLKALQKIVNTQHGHIKVEELITLNSRTSINNAASITSRGNLLIQALQNFKNLADGCIEAKHINAKANLVSNQGKLLARNTLRMEANLILDNLSRGLMLAEDKLELLSNNRLENRGDIYSRRSLILKADRILKNIKAGQIIAGSDLQLRVGHVLSNAGTLSGKENVLLEAAQSVSNEAAGSIYAKKELGVKSESVVQNAGSMLGKEIDVKVGLVFQALASSILVVDEKLRIISDFAIENAGSLKADDICLQSQLFDNLANAEVVAKTELSTNTHAMINQGHCQSTGKLSINSDILWNAETGKISANQILNVFAKRHCDNNGLTYGEKTYIEAPMLCNSGILSALNTLFLKISGTFMHSIHGTLYSEQAIDVLANNLHLLGRVIAKGNFNATVEKYFTYRTQGLCSEGLLKLMLNDEKGYCFIQPIETPGSLSISSSHNININAHIKIGRDFVLSASDIQIKTGGVQANGSVLVESQNLLQTFQDTYLVSTEGSNLIAKIIRIAGNLFTQSNLRLHGSILIENKGKIKVKGDAEFIAPWIQHGVMGNSIQPLLHVDGNCYFYGNAYIHDAQIRVEGTFKYGNLNVRSTEAESKLAVEMEAIQKKLKRKKRRAICRMFISLCIPYYMGGLVGGWLGGFGVGGAKLVVSRGFVTGLSSSAIRGSNIVQGGLGGALFAGVGYGMTQVSFLSQQSEVIQEIARGFSVGALQTALCKGNLLENMAVAGLASGVAAAFIPNSSSNQNLRTDLAVLRALIESGVATLASRSNQSLVTHLANSAIGASVGQALLKMGNQHGYQAASKQKASPIVQSSHQTLTRTSGKQNGSTLKIDTKTFKEQMFKENNSKPTPIGSPITKPQMTSVVIRNGLAKESSKTISTKSTEVVDLGKRFASAVNALFEVMVPTAEALPFDNKNKSSAPLANDKILKSTQKSLNENSTPGFFDMWWRAIKGEQTQAVMNWQQRNIKRLPILNAIHQGIKEGTEACKMVVNARDTAFMPLLHPIDTAESLAMFAWDMSGAASKLLFKNCTESSLVRNSARWQSIKQEYHRFDSGSLTTKLEMINQALLTGTLTMATGSIVFAGAKNAVQITTRQGLKASQEMLALYDVKKASHSFSLESSTLKGKVLQETNFAKNTSIISGQKIADKAPLIPAFDKFKSQPSIPINKPLEGMVPKVRIKTKGKPETQITDAGFYYPEPLLNHELSKVLHWQNSRNRYLKWHRELDISGLPEKTQELIKSTKADSAIRGKMRPNDIAAIFKEERGVKIYDKETGKLLNHTIKGKESNNAIKNVIVDIKIRLDTLKIRGQISTVEAQLLQEKLLFLSELKDTYTTLMKEAKCQSIPNKLRP